MLSLLPSHPAFLPLIIRYQDQRMVIVCRLRLSAEIFLPPLKPCTILPVLLNEIPATGCPYRGITNASTVPDRTLCNLKEVGVVDLIAKVDNPFRSSVIRSSKASLLPSAIIKTLLSLKFIGLQSASKRSAAFLANLQKPTPCTP